MKLGVVAWIEGSWLTRGNDVVAVVAVAAEIICCQWLPSLVASIASDGLVFSKGTQ